jgi:hypothetical protein
VFVEGLHTHLCGVFCQSYSVVCAVVEHCVGLRAVVEQEHKLPGHHTWKTSQQQQQQQQHLHMKMMAYGPASTY